MKCNTLHASLLTAALGVAVAVLSQPAHAAVSVHAVSGHDQPSVAKTAIAQVTPTTVTMNAIVVTGTGTSKAKLNKHKKEGPAAHAAGAAVSAKTKP